MGGSLSNKRLTRKEFQQHIDNALPHLEKVLAGYDFQMVPYYAMKIDFGDVDFVVRANADVIADKVNEVFNPDNLVINDGTISFVFEDFQIDLICTVAHYETSLMYYSYNDIGNLLGRIFHKLGMKFGHEGLLYPLRDGRGSVRKEIVVSTDMEQILKFVDCDYEKWQLGFRTMGEIFWFVARSRYFNRSIFDGDKSANIRKKDKKRKTFNYFLTWLEIEFPMNKFDIDRFERESYIPGIDAFFGVSIAHQKAELIKQLEREEKFKEKFSGDLLMMLTPLTGVELGRFLGQYKRHMLGLTIKDELSKDHNEKFEEVLMDMEQDSINKSIMNFYDGVKN